MQLSIFVAWLAALAVESSAQQQQPTLTTPSADGWRYDHPNSDEFDSGLEKWSQNLGDWIGTPPAVFQASNAAISNSELSLTTKYEPGFVVPGQADDCDCGFGDMTTGMVVSNNKMQYGFFEVRAKFAKASLLSSFWLQGFAGEINAFEAVPASASASGAQKLNTNYHCFVAGGDPDNVEHDSQAVAGLPAGFDATAYHTYGLDWATDKVTFYIDGAEVRILRRGAIGTEGCLDEPMNVVLSVETNQDEGIPEDFTEFSTQFTYFRHWERTEKTASPTVRPTPAPTTTQPTDRPTAQPTDRPTTRPTDHPTAQPTDRPTNQLTGRPSNRPTNRPTPALTSGETTPPTNPNTAPLSDRTCDELRWPFRYSNTEVCGSSRPDKSCNRNGIDHATAANACSAVGSRLCSANELANDATRGTGCGHDGKLVWTYEQCTTEDGRLGRIARRGRSGQKRGTEQRCEPLESTSPRVRCCADRIVSRPPPPPTTAKSCVELGWRFRYGNDDVCGTSHQGFAENGGRRCLSARTHSFANDMCSAVGGRLCTADELARDATRGTGCGHDNRLVWTSDICDGGFMARRGRSGNKRGLEAQCLPTDSSIPAVRCCSDKVVTAPGMARLGVAMQLDADAPPETAASRSGDIRNTLGLVTDAPSMVEVYEEEEENAVYERHAAETAAMAVTFDDYGEDGEDGEGATDASTTGTTVASAVVGVIAIAVLAVAAVTIRSRQQQHQQQQHQRRQSSADPEFAAASAAIAGGATEDDATAAAICSAVDQLPELQSARSYSAAEHDNTDAGAFDDNGFVYDPEGSLRMKSVRRANPAYINSVYMPTDAVGPAGVEGKTDI